jgi:hypothetical protein
VPTVTEELVDAWAWCQALDEDGLPCEGLKQRRVRGLRRTTVKTYADSGGNIPGAENSFSFVWFADESDMVCDFCGAANAGISEQERPVLARVHHDADKLFEMRRQKIEARAMDVRIAEMQAQIATLTANRPDQGDQLAALQAQIDELQNAPKPKTARAASAPEAA